MSFITAFEKQERLDFCFQRQSEVNLHVDYQIETTFTLTKIKQDRTPLAETKQNQSLN
jgi:hypothetical protein